MKRNDDIMLAVFKKFLDNPQVFRLENMTGDAIKGFFQPNLTADSNLLRWHIALFLSEFIVDEETFKHLATGDLYFKESTDYLTWSGYKVFCELQHRTKNNPQ